MQLTRIRDMPFFQRWVGFLPALGWLSSSVGSAAGACFLLLLVYTHQVYLPCNRRVLSCVTLPFVSPHPRSFVHPPFARLPPFARPNLGREGRRAASKDGARTPPRREGEGKPRPPPFLPRSRRSNKVALSSSSSSSNNNKAA